MMDFRNDPEVRAIVITGEGSSFSAGGDVKEMVALRQQGAENPHFVRRQVRQFHAMIEAIYETEKPVLAAINGPAIGAGCCLALACDLRIASEEAKFSLAFVLRGLTADSGATYLLPRLVGYAKAYEMLALGNMVAAREALDIGLVNKVVAPSELMAAAEATAELLAAGPPDALAVLKRSLRLSESATLHASLEHEANMQALCLLGKEHAEGVTAFMEKRPPEF